MMSVLYFGFLSRFAQLTTCDPDKPGNCDVVLPKVNAGNAQLQTILQLFFGVVAAGAVVYIVLAGLKYVTAQGDPQGVGRAKMQIIYAVVGLVVALSAEIIVTFFVKSL